MQLLDVIRLTRDLPGAPRGTAGTIVAVLDGPPPAFEVEVVGPNGETIALVTAEVADVELLHALRAPRTPEPQP